jgi:hypothetical protein
MTLRDILWQDDIVKAVAGRPPRGDQRGSRMEAIVHGADVVLLRQFVFHMRPEMPLLCVRVYGFEQRRLVPGAWIERLPGTAESCPYTDTHSSGVPSIYSSFIVTHRLASIGNLYTSAGRGRWRCRNSPGSSAKLWQVTIKVLMILCDGHTQGVKPGPRVSWSPSDPP